MLPALDRPTPAEGEAPGETARDGDIVRFVGPHTKAVWPDLLVETAYPRQAKASVLGHFGAFDAAGAELKERRRISLLYCVVTRRAGESV